MEVTELFDVSRSIAGKLLSEADSVWDAIPAIEDYIDQLSKELSSTFQEIQEKVWVGPGTTIAPTALIQGPAIIGANCEIRHGAFIRNNVICGDNAVIGNSTEVKNAILFDGVQIPHFNYVGDSIMGYRAHLGAGAIVSNFKATGKEIHVFVGGEKTKTGLNKLGAILGDGVEVGCNAVLFPGTIIGRNSIIYPLNPVRGTFPAEAILKNDGRIYPKAK